VAQPPLPRKPHPLHPRKPLLPRKKTTAGVPAAAAGNQLAFTNHIKGPADLYRPGLRVKEKVQAMWMGCNAKLELRVPLND
jgi:hypothetical protein